MHRVKTKYLAPGMEVARNIYNSNGQILLRAGVVLNNEYIVHLYQLDLPSVYIKDEFDLEDDLPVDVVSEQTRVETTKIIKKNFENLEHDRKINIGAVKGAVDKLIDELMANTNILVNLRDIRAFDDYTFAHSVNVCILALMSGISLGYTEKKLNELGTGALMHDIGKTRISKDILNKPDTLTKEEYNEIKNHTTYGFEILRVYSDISLLSAHVAYQHHERWDGKGYPRGLKCLDIHEYARIVAVADVYDALMADRPYRPSYSVNQAITILKNMTGTYLDSHCVSALLANIAIYPLGSLIELNTGEIGIVVDNNKDTPSRPVVRILYDRNRHRLNSPHEVDLSKLSTIIITRSLDEENIAQLHL